MPFCSVETLSITMPAVWIVFLFYSTPQLTGPQSTGPSLSIRWLHLLKIAVDIKIRSQIACLLKLYGSCFMKSFWSVLILILQSQLWKDLTSIVKNKEATRWCCVVVWKSCANSNYWHFRHLVIFHFFGREPSVMSAVVPCSTCKHLWGCTVTPLMFHFQNFVDSGVQTMLTVL